MVPHIIAILLFFSGCNSKNNVVSQPNNASTTGSGAGTRSGNNPNLNPVITGPNYGYFTVGVNTSVSFSVTNGLLRSCAATNTNTNAAGLPSGLTLNQQTCQISGAITATMPPATYTITATNATGSGSTSITLLGVGLLNASAGAPHMCGITGSGGVMCWGGNASMQLGNGNTTNQLSPVAVNLPTGTNPVVHLSLQDNQSCALLSTGNVFCWGGGSAVGSMVGGSSPIAATSISSSEFSSCVLTPAGGVQCWGDINGSSTPSAVAVSGATGPLTQMGMVSTGGFCTTIAPLSIFCIGIQSAFGELTFFQASGIKSLNSQPYTFTNTSGTVTQISTGGGAHFCALFADGTVECWGNNDQGQLGTGVTSALDTTANPAPNKVIGLTEPAIQVSAGWKHSCALMASGKIQCWGTNINGQLGGGVNYSTSNGCSNTPPSLPIGVNGALVASPNVSCAPVPVSGIVSSAAVSQVICDAQSTCALLTSGQMQCWGVNRGDGTSLTVNNPTQTASAVLAGMP